MYGISNKLLIEVIRDDVAVRIVALVRVVMTRSGASESRSAATPVEILRRRYAAGELTHEQFEAMKRDVA